MLILTHFLLLLLAFVDTELVDAFLNTHKYAISAAALLQQLKAVYVC
jgi:hypothetical protein